MKKFTLLILLIPIVLFSYDANKEFDRANDLYNSGQYDDAAKIYHTLIDSGYKNAIIYYNLGNAYYRLDKMPQAILYYERAKKLAPMNEDILFNLKLANLKIVDKFEPLPKLFFIEWYDTLLEIGNSDSWSIVFIIFIWLTIITLYLTFWTNFSYLIKKRLFIISIIFFFISILSILLTFRTYYKEKYDKNAIIFSPSVYVKSSPDQNATDLFILHEGTKVQLLDHINDWYEVKVQNGNVGWIQKNNFEEI